MVFWGRHGSEEESQLGQQSTKKMVRRGEDISYQIEGIHFIHQNIPDRMVELHAHEEHHIFIPLSGSINIGFADQSWHVAPGSMAYLPGRLPHNFESQKGADGERIICMISEKTWKACGGKDLAPALLSANQLIKEMSFYLLLHPQSQLGQPLVTALVQALQEQIELAGAQPQTTLFENIKTIQEPRLRHIITFLESHYFEEIEWNEVAENAQMSVRTMNRLFQDTLKTTPKQVLTRYRIQAATELLRGGKLAVTDVAYEVGFGSLSRFIESFKSVTGVLPTDYRRGG